MSSLVREYGVVALLIAVGIAGYLLYWNHKADILAYSLDVVGERLVAMVDDGASRTFVAERFAQFKAQVLAREVDPGEVASVAANVLNLSNRGSRLTPEQAELVLRFAAAAPEAVRVPSPPVEAAAPPVPAPPPAPVAPEALEALAARLDAVLALNRKVHETAGKRGVPPEELAQHIEFRFEHGLHVDVDSSLAAALRQADMGPLAREIREMEKHKMVIWKGHLAEVTRAEQEQARREAAVVAEWKTDSSAATLRPHLESLEALKHLEALGYTPRFDVDSLQRVIQEQVRAAEAVHRRAPERRGGP